MNEIDRLEADAKQAMKNPNFGMLANPAIVLTIIARLRAAEGALEACRDYATSGAQIGAGMTERERLGGVWAQATAHLTPTNTPVCEDCGRATGTLLNGHCYVCAEALYREAFPPA